MSSEMSGDSEVEGARDPSSSTLDQRKQELEEEFNAQRARMKELFLQKEEDMRKMVQDKQQLESEVLGLRAELEQLHTLSQNQMSELQNLQLLVSETVEASSSGTEHLRLLSARNQELEHQLAQLRQQLQQQQLQQQELSLAPATFVRSLARKLGADDDAPAKKHPPGQGQEESELQSIIQPLNDEIGVLKAKLRDTDTQLQNALKSKSRTTGSPSLDASGENKADTEPSRARECDMCANYEQQLVATQAAADAAAARATRHENALKLASEELEGVRSLHDETIRTWQTERAAAGEGLSRLRAAVRHSADALRRRLQDAQLAEQQALHAVTTLTVDREMLQRKLDSLEKENAYLVGQYTKKAAEMQNDAIDLPDNVEELQELTLRLREQMIVCAIGREKIMADESACRAQLSQHAKMLQKHEANAKVARNELEELRLERIKMQDLANQLRQATTLSERLLEDKKRLQSESAELRSRVYSLQQELDNSEKVQQDFVRLSQSLQVQLQRIREADTEVRWQHDEDVSECPECHVQLINQKKKVHCRHCGRIFCAGCVRHGVAAGPRGVPARVCGVCRTLLQPHSAPYFSTDPPRSPD